MNIDIADKDLLEKWKKDAEESSFFGIKVKDLDRDALLSAIGNLIGESKYNKQGYEKQIEMLEMLDKYKNRKHQYLPWS